MTLREYTNASGPAGMEVSVRIPADDPGKSEQRTKRFSYKKYGRLAAPLLADELNTAWEAEAAEAERLYSLIPKGPAKAGSIMRGLSAIINVTQLGSGGQTIYVGFEVRSPHDRHKHLDTETFGVRRHGFADAWKKAVRAYIKLYGHSARSEQDFLALMPDKKKLAIQLAEQIQEKHPNITRYHVARAMEATSHAAYRAA